MNQPMSFEILLDACELVSMGRKNAAKSQWDCLSPEFQEKVLEFTLKLMKPAPPLNKTVVLSTKFGYFSLNDYNADLLKRFVPQLITL